MKKSSIVLLLAFVAAFAATAHAADEGVFINTGDLKWGDAPPVLPKGAKIAVLNGDPFKRDSTRCACRSQRTTSSRRTGTH